MKKVGVRNSLLCLMALLGVSSFAMPQQAKAWDIICRGGGNVEVRYNSWETGSGVMMFFWKGSAPAGNGLEPGQCSWPDRGMWAAEPTAICMDRSLINRNITISIKRGRAVATTTDPAADTIRAMFTLINDSNFYYTFDVNNNGRDCLVPSR